MRRLLPLFLILLLLVAWNAQAQTWQSAIGVPVVGSSNNVVMGVTTNTTGDIFVVGGFTGTATFGNLPTLTSTSGSEDMYVAKWSKSTNTRF